jgi:hypothetical protein
MRNACTACEFLTKFFAAAKIIIHQQGKKTNLGTQLYGHVMRHKLVHLCSLGGIVFYLTFRFATMKEFDLYTAAKDWLDNKKWFDIKLLVDATRNDADHCKVMANNTYADIIKATLRGLNIPSNHWVHLGWTLVPKFLELLEEESEDIRWCLGKEIGMQASKSQALLYQSPFAPNEEVCCYSEY